MTKMEKADSICQRLFGVNFCSWLDKTLPGFKVVNERLEIIKEIKDDDLLFLQQKNKELKNKTKIDFMAWLKNCARSEAKCEVEARRFLRENYPHNDVDEDKRALGLLMKYYYEKEAEHEVLKKINAEIHVKPVSYDSSDKPFRPRHQNHFSGEDIQLLPHPLENPYDKPFRCKYLGNFISDLEKVEFAMGFFPKD